MPKKPPVFEGNVPPEYLTDEQMEHLGLKPRTERPDAIHKYDLRPEVERHGTQRLFLRENTVPQEATDAAR